MKGQTLENKLIIKKEAIELAMACGYIAGEMHEVTKNGLGMEDMDSLVDVAKNYPIIKEGFDIKVKMSRENLAQLEREDLTEIVLAIYSGFKKGEE